MSDELTQQKRGRPFEVGNAGRPKGAKGKATLLTDALHKCDPDALQSLVKTTYEAAQAGKSWAIQILMDRLFPVPDGRLVQLPIREMHKLDNVAGAISDVVQAVGRGELTVAEGAALSSLITDQAAPILDRAQQLLDAHIVEAEANG